MVVGVEVVAEFEESRVPVAWDYMVFHQQMLTRQARFRGACTPNQGRYLLDLVLLEKPEVVVEVGTCGGKSLFALAYGCFLRKQGQVYGVFSRAGKGTDAGYRSLWQKMRREHLTCVVNLLWDQSARADAIETIDLLHLCVPSSLMPQMVERWGPKVREGGVIVCEGVGSTQCLDQGYSRVFICQEAQEDWGVWRK